MVGAGQATEQQHSSSRPNHGLLLAELAPMGLHLMQGRACAPEAVPAHFQRRIGVALANGGGRALHTAAQAVVHQLGACCARRWVSNAAGTAVATARGYGLGLGKLCGAA